MGIVGIVGIVGIKIGLGVKAVSGLNESKNACK